MIRVGVFILDVRGCGVCTWIRNRSALPPRCAVVPAQSSTHFLVGTVAYLIVLHTTSTLPLVRQESGASNFERFRKKQWYAGSHLGSFYITRF